MKHVFKSEGHAYFRALGGFVINFFKYIDGVLMVLSTGKYSCLVDLLVLINL